MEKFSKVIGYAVDEDVNSVRHLEKATIVREILNTILNKQIIKDILIAGCGSKGDEAKAFQKVFNQHVTGVDISLPMSEVVENDDLNLLNANLTKLPFDNDDFSFIYCYHVLEHVDDPKAVLQELKRVLRNDGVIFIGFPNRYRIVPSYFSSNLKISVFKILKYNLRDYWHKLTGRFKNEYGAHAGFSEKEFLYMASTLFTNVLPIRGKWIELNYSKYYWIFKIAKKLKLDEIMYPSNYYLLKI
jgi:ubiquinone/menaquinone biosynthesis C-methylase UbiE